MRDARRVRSARQQRGMVMIVVLFFALLLTSSIAVFIRRSTVDSVVAHNRESAARAEALARGGVRLARALLSQDRILKETGALPVDTHLDTWYRMQQAELPIADDATLRIRIEDSGSRFNLNALFDYALGGLPYAETEPFLFALFDKVIDEMKVPPGELVYDVSELAEALQDWVDQDDVRLAGGYEDDYYQGQDPPYRSANRPLLSVDDLMLIEGFDRALVDALRPYVTVFPFVGGEGVNLNTAPAHILALVYANDGVDDRIAKKDEVKRMLDIREEGGILCGEGLSHPACTPITSIVPNAIFPPPTFTSAVFTIVARARVGPITRTVEAVVDRSLDPPMLLSWKVR